jgi:hypothetical protein
VCVQTDTSEALARAVGDVLARPWLHVSFGETKVYQIHLCVCLCAYAYMNMLMVHVPFLKTKVYRIHLRMCVCMCARARVQAFAFLLATMRRLGNRRPSFPY